MLKNNSDFKSHNELNYFYKELPYGDPQAVRFEEGAKKLAHYQMQCIELTFPYTVLTWIMVDFITSYYFSDINGFEEDTQEFWNRAESSALYQYEIRINNSSNKQAQLICHNVVKTYRAILCNGYNLAKPVPIAENPNGEIVAVKGAKRIAALLAFGFDWVTVLEYDPSTFVDIAPEQDLITCINHSKIIFSKLSDIPSVKVLEARYKQYLCWKSNSGKQIILTSLRKLIKKEEFYKQVNTINQIDSNIFKLVNELDSITPNRIAIIIENKINLIEWLYLRNICNIFLIADIKLYEVLENLSLFTDFIIINLTIDTDLKSIGTKYNYQELWYPKGLSTILPLDITTKKY